MLYIIYQLPAIPQTSPQTVPTANTVTPLSASLCASGDIIIDGVPQCLEDSEYTATETQYYPRLGN